MSVGVSRTKTLAKLASDKSKTMENHVCIVGKCGIKKLLKSTEIGEIWGVGRRLEPRLRGHGIYMAYDYVQKNDIWLKSRFGKLGLELKYELLGNLINKVSTEQQPPKSIMDTKSFPEFSSDLNYLKNELMVHIHAACRKLRKADCKCKTIGVILKTKDFQVFCEKADLKHPTNFEFNEFSQELEESGTNFAKDLLTKINAKGSYADLFKQATSSISNAFEQII